jgi:hypothetical protein
MFTEMCQGLKTYTEERDTDIRCERSNSKRVRFEIWKKLLPVDAFPLQYCLAVKSSINIKQ